MPKVAEMVDGFRAEMGREWVDACITAAIRRGEPDQFYAVEGGHIVGQPFTVDVAMNEPVKLAFMVGGAAAVIRMKEGAT